MSAHPEHRDAVYRDALELMRVLVRGIGADEALADQVASIADIAEREGYSGEAAALRATARNHRIRVLEAQGYLAALNGTYGPLLNDEI